MYRLKKRKEKNGRGERKEEGGGRGKRGRKGKKGRERKRGRRRGREKERGEEREKEREREIQVERSLKPTAINEVALLCNTNIKGCFVSLNLSIKLQFKYDFFLETHCFFNFPLILFPHGKLQKDTFQFMEGGIAIILIIIK